METGNNQQVSLILRQFKQKDGTPNYPAVFSIPSTERLPVLAAQDFHKVNLLMIGAITVAFESLTFKKPMNEIQILNLSELIIDSSHEDNLSFEDVILFLQQMVAGKYEFSSESMDVPRFMKLFNTYREERHQAILNFRENQQLEYKAIGDAHRTLKENPLADHFSKLGGSLHELKMGMLEQKREAEVVKKMNKLYGD